MKNKPDIEKVLQDTKVPHVTMDTTAKDRILFELLQQPAAQKNSVEEPVPPTPWWKRIFLPQIVIVGSAFAVIALVMIWVLYTPADTQLVNTSTPQETVNKNTIKEVANTNANTNSVVNKNTNTPQENVPDEAIVEDVPVEVVEAVETTEYVNTELEPRLERINGTASLYLGLGGGHPGLEGLTFKFTNSVNTTTQSLPRDLITLRTLYDSELHDFANVFPIDSASSVIDTFGSTNKALMNIVGDIPDEHLFGRCVDLFADPVEAAKVERCVSVSELGRVDLMQSTARAEADGMSEAFTYIEELTGYNPDQFVTVPSDIAGEYDIYYKYSLNAEMALRDLGWHITLKDGKLISLIGYVQPDVLSANSTDTISSAEAYDRFVKAYEFQDTTNPHFTRAQTYEYSELVYDFIDNGPVITMNVEEIALEYMPAEVHTERSEANRTTVQLIPVYRMSGNLNGTTNLFTVYIDATRSGDVFTGRVVWYNIGYLR